MTSDHTAEPSHSDFYDRRWAEQGDSVNHLKLRRFAEIMSAVSEVRRETGHSPLRICDLGCGSGWISNQLRFLGDVTAVDISPKGIEIAKEHYPDVTFQVHDAITFRDSRGFELVVSSEVIEHVSNQAAYVDAINAILRPGGYVILTCPNATAKRAAEKAGFLSQPLENWLTRKQLLSLFAQRDLIVCKHRVFELDFAYSGLFRFSSAPKLLRLLESGQLIHVYNGVRVFLRLGLHHLLIAKKPS